MNARFYLMQDKSGKVLVAIVEKKKKNHCEKSMKEF